MKVVITGAGGNLGRAVTPLLSENGHEVALSDIAPIPDAGSLRFVEADVITGIGLDEALAGADLLLHLPAWHGIHVAGHTEDEFWQLNVEGTRNALEGAARAGIGRVVFLSSGSWHDRLGTYGFTKVIGELLLEYHRAHHGVSYVALRPGDFTPWGDDWAGRYGARLLYGGVDRDDVADAVVASVRFLEDADAAVVLDVGHPTRFAEADLVGWEDDPLAAVERVFPGSAELVARCGLDVARRPSLTRTAGQAQIGWTGARDFGTFVEQARGMTDEQIAAMRCPY